MTWSGMPLSRGSGHFCTCGERRAAKYRDAHDACGCRLYKYNSVRAWCMGNDSCEHADSCGVPERALCACGVLWAADIGMGMLLKDTYVRPATCGFQHLREPGCALWGSSCKLPKSSVTASVAAWKCPANVPVAPIFTRSCVLGTQSCRRRCAPCCRRPRWLYASRLIAERCHRWRVGCALLSCGGEKTARFQRSAEKRLDSNGWRCCVSPWDTSPRTSGTGTGLGILVGYPPVCKSRHAKPPRTHTRTAAAS
jgi:hypothetical protein